MTELEMEGFLRGKCVPSDLKVNETNAEYLVRKFAELENKCAALAEENAGLKSDIPLGAIENGRAFAERLENYQFECEGGNLNMCSDWQEFRRCFEYLSEWAMHSQTEHPATDAFLAEVRAEARNEGINSPVIPDEVLSAIREVARIRADFDDFDGDRRGIGDCLDEAEQELIVTINKYASQLAAEPIATNDVREQTAVPPIQADVAQSIENLKQKLVECNRYNYCADAVKNVEDACRAAMLQGSQPVSQTYKLPVNTPCQDAPAHIWLQTAGVWPEDGELSELTWCSHNQHHDDTLYVRADLVNGNYPTTPDSWISCSERMPDSNCLYLCWGTYFEGDEPDYIPAYFFVHKTNGWTEWQPVEDDCNPREVIITHWMPLPAAPKQEVK